MREIDPHATSNVDECRIINLPRISGDNGDLTVVENTPDCPFKIKRVYYLYDVPADADRGGHSHRRLESLIIAVTGAFTVTLDDGARTRSFTLNRPFQALHVKQGIWRTLSNFSSGSVCLVVASEKYDEDDYVRDYDTFLSLTACKRKSDALRYPFLDLGDVNRPYMPQLIEAATRVITSGCYVGGEEVKMFEKEAAAIAQVPYGIGVSNGLDALRLILRGYMQLGRIKPGQEVIVPANTFIATVLAITDCGLEPVFVEPDPETCNIDTARIEEAITPRTAAIMPVHLYGRVVWDERLAEVAKKHNLPVIEDCAQAFGAVSATPGLFGTTAAGGLGHASGVSFYPTKNVGALGDAGIVLTHDAELAEAVASLRNYGTDRPYHNVYAGLNCRLDPMQAAMLRVKLPHLVRENEHRIMLAKTYDECITNPLVVLPKPGEAPMSHVYHQYVVRVADRDAFRKYMEDRGVGTNIHYPTPPHRQPCYSQYAHLYLPIADRLGAEVVSLPMHGALTEADARAIAAIVNDYR